MFQKNIAELAAGLRAGEFSSEELTRQLSRSHRKI